MARPRGVGGPAASVVGPPLMFPGLGPTFPTGLGALAPRGRPWSTSMPGFGAHFPLVTRDVTSAWGSSYQVPSR